MSPAREQFRQLSSEEFEPEWVKRRISNLLIGWGFESPRTSGYPRICHWICHHEHGVAGDSTEAQRSLGPPSFAEKPAETPYNLNSRA